MVLQYLPKPLLTPDQVEMLRIDNVVSEAAKARWPHAAKASASAGAMEAIVPAYLWRFRKTGQFRNRTA